MVSNNSIVQHTPSSAINIHGSGPSLTLLQSFSVALLNCESTFQAMVLLWIAARTTATWMRVNIPGSHQMQPDKRQPMVKDRKPYECEPDKVKIAFLW